MNNFLKICLFCTILFEQVFCSDFSLIVKTDSPVAQGSSVTFNITLLKFNKPAPEGVYQLEYRFEGDTKTFDFKICNFSFSISTDDLSQGKHSVDIQVNEIHYFVIPVPVADARVKFDVANFFHGGMTLIQNKTIRSEAFVSSKSPTVHQLAISDNERNLFDRASYYRVFWFVNCQYVGETNSLSYESWYQTENDKFDVEAVLMLSFHPLPPVTTTTTTTPKPTTTTTTTTSTSTTTPSTTTSSTTTTTTPTTTTSSTSTTPSTTTSSTTSTSTTTISTTTTKKSINRRKRSTGSSKFVWNVDHLIKTGSIKPNDILFGNTTEPSRFSMTTSSPTKDDWDDQVPYFGVCTNNTKIVTDPKKIYGYYKRSFSVQNPIENITFEGDVWLKHDDLCKLQFKYQGTGPVEYCVLAKNSKNNSTELTSAIGNSSECDTFDWKKSDMNTFEFHRFFTKNSDAYTLYIFVKNEVSLDGRVVGIHYYKPTPRSQLSVIIVPVMFTLISIFLIIFGVAYYMQNRNQFLVETADFNFGETQSIDSLEYKSFLQRLLDSISDVFIKNNYIDDSGSPNGETSNQGYNTME